jgi:hypothetical protein
VHGVREWEYRDLLSLVALELDGSWPELPLKWIPGSYVVIWTWLLSLSASLWVQKQEVMATCRVAIQQKKENDLHVFIETRLLIMRKRATSPF